MRARHASRFDIRRKYPIYLTLIVVCAAIIIVGLWIRQAASKPAVPARSGSSVAASISLLPGRRLAAIPGQFVGFSMETADVCPFLQAQRTHPEINAYLANFRPYTLRIGGNSADNLSWHAERSCPAWYARSFGTAVIDDLFAYARKNDVRVIWTVNFKNQLPAAAAEEAAYVSKAGGANLVGIAIGNEPNDYRRTTYARLAERWHGYYASIRQKAPDVPIVGPDTAQLLGCKSCGSAYFQPFVQRYAPLISMATMHYYPLSGKTATIAQLLSKGAADELIHTIQASDIVKRGPTPVVIDETNSAYSGGRRGVSDTFAAALWGLDYLYTAAENGIQGVYFHGSMGAGNGAYTPLGKRFIIVQAKPIFYAMLAFRDSTSAGTAVQSSVHAPINITSHAVLAADGKLHLTIINKDLVTGATVTVALPGGYRAATAIRLEAPAADAKADDITLGGSTMSGSGQWHPVTIERPPIVGGSLLMTVPAASAASVTLYQ